MVASAVAVICIAVAGCAAKATPVARPSGSPTPIFCDDNPGHYTPMPADCVVPTEAATPSVIPTASVAPPTIDPNFALPTGLATLPPAVSGHGKTIYSAPKGAGVKLIGLGPDDTIYVLLARPLASPKPTPKAAIVAPDVKASVLAIRPDGSTRPGWPSAGVSISGYPYSYKVNEQGTVFVTSGVNPYGGQAQDAQSSLTITAIGSDGKVLPGWPYRTPAAAQSYDPELLVPGPGGIVCFLNVKPGASPFGYDVPMVLYCLGRNGKLMPGWPYSGNSLFSPAVGPDGTVYVAQTTSTDLSAGVTSFPYRVLAIGQDGKPKLGWTPWARADNRGLTSILPTKNGRIYMLLGGDSGKAQLVTVDSTGKTLDDHPELGNAGTSPEYKDAVLASDGSLFVSIDDGLTAEFVNAYSPNGTEMTGWPQRIGGWGDIAVGSQGSLWVAWTVYGPGDTTNETSVVALFDKNGNLQPGYPIATDFLSWYHSYGLRVASDGTAYATVLTAAGSKIVAFGP
jgi:hypothetical protein